MFSGQVGRQIYNEWRLRLIENSRQKIPKQSLNQFTWTENNLQDMRNALEKKISNNIQAIPITSDPELGLKNLPLIRLKR